MTEVTFLTERYIVFFSKEIHSFIQRGVRIKSESMLLNISILNKCFFNISIFV